MACISVSFACVTCVFVLIACHVTLTTAEKCQCSKRDDTHKYCNADFAIHARIMNTRPSNSEVKQYKILIRRVIKESGGFPVEGEYAVLQLPANCKVSLKKRATYFITGTFATYSSSSNFKALKTAQLLQTSACELVEKFNKGKTGKPKIDAWYDSEKRPTDQQCRAIKMQFLS